MELLPTYAVPIQAGASLTNVKMCDLRDNIGDNISYKNAFYCELTALYWLWKNENLPEYVGFNFYSRIFDFNEQQLSYILSNGIEAIVPEPALLSSISAFPTIVQQNNRQVENFLERAIAKTHPDYSDTYCAVLKERITLPSNIFILQKNIFKDYVKWLFDIEDEYENLLVKSGKEIPPRNPGYLAEALQTTYFLKNSSTMNILFAKRKFLF